MENDHQGEIFHLAGARGVESFNLDEFFRFFDFDGNLKNRYICVYIHILSLIHI